MGFLCGLFLLALLGPLSATARAGQGVFDYWGNSSPASSQVGGEFFVDDPGLEGKVGPNGIAVRDTTGHVYVSSNGGIRISEFTEDG